MPAGVQELPLELALRAVRDASALGYRNLVIDGGEPLLHRGLCEILRRAARHGLRTTVVTNGTLLHQARHATAIATVVDRISVVLYGDASTHDAAVGRDGAFARATTNLALLRARGVPFAVQVPLTRSTAPVLQAVVALAADHEAESIELRCSWRGGLSDIEAARVVADCASLAGDAGVVVRSDLIGREALMVRRGEYVPAPSSPHLSVLAPTLVVEATGRVRPLGRELPDHLLLGNLHAARLAQLAPAWLAGTAPRRLVEACDRAWWSAVAPDAPPATRWVDELALHVTAPARSEQLLAAA